MSKEQYNDEPVYYCAHCHSLNIGVDEEGADGEWDGSYCLKCGGTDILQCSIFEWLDEESKLHAREKRWIR